MKLSDIESFGGTAAEDDDIKRFFVRTPTFTNLIEGKKHVVVGRKGAGKTALYLALDDYAKDHERSSVGLTFKKYPWKAHYKYASTDVETTERFIDSWTFLMLIEAWRLVLAGRPLDLDRRQKDCYKVVKKFIEDNYGVIDFDFKRAFPAGGLKLDQLDIGPEVLGNSLGSAGIKKSSQSLGETLSRVNEWLTNKLLILGNKVNTTYLLFDELDLGFDPKKQEYTDRVIGLLLATRSFVKEITKKGVPVHPIIFLRSDIFDDLHFGDKNKILNAEVEQLVWHDRLDHNGSSLKHLIDWRVKEALEDVSLGDAWSTVFDEQVMRGTQHKFQHITFRSYLRPRDVIHFANLSLQAAKDRITRTGDQGRITNEDVRAARTSYSQYLVLELDDEIAEAEPDWSSMLDILRTVGSAKFGSEEFHDAYQSVVTRKGITRSEADVLVFMYKYSIIGFERAVTGAGIEHHFRYLNEAVTFEPDAKSFLVHRGLKENLGLTETLQNQI